MDPASRLPALLLQPPARHLVVEMAIIAIHSADRSHGMFNQISDVCEYKLISFVIIPPHIAAVSLDGKNQTSIGWGRAQKPPPVSANVSLWGPQKIFLPNIERNISQLKFW